MPMTTEPAVDPSNTSTVTAAPSPEPERAGIPPEVAGPRDPGGGGGPSGGLSLAKIVVLALALAFFVGAAGYFVGVRTAGPPTSAVDEGFLQDMSDHHDQAVEMALLGIARATDPTVRHFATEVLIFQRRELGLLQAYQQERDITPAVYDPDRTTMAWMDMSRPLSEMNGMASPEQLDQLAAATGTEFDQLFLELMQNHHRGGIHMAEYAEANAADPKIRTLAGQMARNQAAEVNEYQLSIDRLRG